MALIYFQSILIPFAVSLFLYCLINPITDYLHKGHNLPNFIYFNNYSHCNSCCLNFGAWFCFNSSFVADAGQYNQKIPVRG